MQIPASLLVHTVPLTPLLGEGSNGPLWGTPVDLQCMAQGGLRLLRTIDGDTVTAALTLYCAPGTVAATGSRVTWDGGTWTVVQSIPHDDGDLGTPQHVEVICQ